MTATPCRRPLPRLSLRMLRTTGALALLLAAGAAGAAGCGSPAASPASPETWLAVRQGRQCELTGERRAELAKEERARLEAEGVPPRSLDVASSIAGLPPGCRPPGGVQGLAARAAREDAQEMVELLSTMACAACGCPEPWFVCTRAEAQNPDDLERLDFLRVR